MSGRGSRRAAARLLCAAASAAFICAPVFAQDAQDPAELDPSAPMAPLRDLGVDWPDLNARDETPPAPEASPPAEGAASEPAVTPAPADESRERRYTVAVEGLDRLGNAAELLEEFRKQSALEQGHGKPANV